jgi:uncharacterized membrane protein YkoI
MSSRMLLVMCCTLFFAAGLAQAAEKKVKMSELPPAVQDAVKQQSKGAVLRGLSEEVEHGKTFYEAELMVDGHSKDVSMDSAGKVVSVEEEVKLDTIPAAAREAIQKSAGSGKILKVEAVTEGDKPPVYEAALRRDQKKSEVRVDREGKPAPED